MKDRGMIKWMPFSSIILGKELLINVESKRNKLKKPWLSFDQLEELNNIIKYHKNNTLIITYFKDGNYHTIIGLITKIDYIKKSITIDNTILYTKEIIGINIYN